MAVLVSSLLVEAVLLQQAVGALPAARELAGTGEALTAEMRIGSALCTAVLAAALTAWTSWCASVLRALQLAGCPPGPPPALGRGSGWVRVAALALGVGAAGLAAAPASADPGPGRPCDPAVESAPAAPAGARSIRLDGLALPVLPAAPPAAAAGSTIVVAPGDSLWTLAAARLGPAADPAAVDRLWRRWYAANRTAIGPDPDLLVPGQRLRLPPPTRTDQRTHP